MTTGEPAEDYAEVVGRLLVRVYEIHERVLAKGGGGLEGIRDAPMLHAAVARPFATFGGLELYPSDFEKAAALFHSLIKSHPFMDGTKRTAFASAIYFLQERGYSVRRPLPKDKVIRLWRNGAAFAWRWPKKSCARRRGNRCSPRPSPR